VGRKTAVVLAVFGTLLLAIGGGGLVYWLQTPASRVVIITPIQPAAVPGNPVPKANRAPVEVPHAAISEVQQDALAQQLRSDSAADREQAMEQIHTLASTDPRSLSQGLPSWAGPMIDNKQYDDVEKLTIRAIVTRDSDSEIIESLQRARVMAFMAEGNYPQALKEAKSYYNVVSLSGTGDAISLLTQILLKTDPSAAVRFQTEQMVGAQAAGGATTQPASLTSLNTDPPPPQEAAAKGSVLKSIQVDSDVYAKPIASLLAKQNAKGQHSYNRIARGNLLLLADEPSEALASFLAACPMARGEKNTRDAVEGVARAMRAQDGNVARANAFVLSLREDPSVQGAGLVSHAKAAPTVEDFRLAATNTAIAGTGAVEAPPLEADRRNEEDAAGDMSSHPVRLETGFAGSAPLIIKRITATHFEISLASQDWPNWFIFKIDGAAHRIVRVDIKGAISRRWWSLNPVYSELNDLSDLNGFQSIRAVNEVAHTVSWNGSLLPDTSSQRWHFISGVWQSDTDALSFVQRFEGDHVYVAMKVPYLPSYNEHYIASLAGRPGLRVHEIGTSSNGHPLQIVEIGSADAKTTPCVLLYAREHADEQDSSWVAQGCIDFLSGDSTEAAQMRSTCTFLVIPLLDPDGANAGVYERNCLPSRPCPVVHHEFLRGFVHA
jgi:hypothetical protein